jgi:hypothetical protein
LLAISRILRPKVAAVNPDPLIDPEGADVVPTSKLPDASMRMRSEPAALRIKFSPKAPRDTPFTEVEPKREITEVPLESFLKIAGTPPVAEVKRAATPDALITSRGWAGLLVPIPTFPALVMRNRSTPFVEAVTTFAPVVDKANVPAFVTSGVVTDVVLSTSGVVIPFVPSSVIAIRSPHILRQSKPSRSRQH